jgi:LPS export ABC transporter protein LptC
MKKIRYILLAAASLTFILVMGALVRNALTPPLAKPVGNAPPPGVNVQIDKIHYEQTDRNAKKEWELDAQSAQYFKESNKIVFKSLVAIFFSAQGKMYKLTADHGELSTDSKDVKMSGNVEAVTGEGYTINANSFQYSAQERKIFTNDEVTLSSEKLVMSGKGMVVDLDEERLYILKEVKALEKK